MYEQLKQGTVTVLWLLLLTVLIAIAVPIFCYNRIGEKYAEKKSA